MKLQQSFVFFSVLLTLLISGCDRFKPKNQPQIEDINSVGCLITNDFYAVHFSAYLKPETSAADTDRKALLTPYCQDLPSPGQAFFAADLIDRDIRQTPIGIKVMEVERTGEKPEDFKELRVIVEDKPKLYPRGVVEAQAKLDKDGDYILMLIIGGDEALSAEDRMKIPVHVGTIMFGLTKPELITAVGIGAGVLAVLLITPGLFFYFRKKRRVNG